MIAAMRALTKCAQAMLNVQELLIGIHVEHIFKASDSPVINRLGLNRDEKYVILRR